MSWQQQEFSFAYIEAVAAAAGYSVQRRSVDYDGIDLSIHAHGGGGTVVSPQLDVQVKSQSAGKPSGFPWSYPLEVDNYKSLRRVDLLVPRALVVVAMPKNVGDWIKATPHQLSIRHCGYWLSLKGAPVTTNTTSVTVHLPRKQRLTPRELDAIMKRIGEGKDP